MTYRQEIIRLLLRLKLANIAWERERMLTIEQLMQQFDREQLARVDSDMTAAVNALVCDSSRTGYTSEISTEQGVIGGGFEACGVYLDNGDVNPYCAIGG